MFTLVFQKIMSVWREKEDWTRKRLEPRRSGKRLLPRFLTADGSQARAQGEKATELGLGEMREESRILPREARGFGISRFSIHIGGPKCSLASIPSSVHI